MFSWFPLLSSNHDVLPIIQPSSVQESGLLRYWLGQFVLGSYEHYMSTIKKLGKYPAARIEVGVIMINALGFGGDNISRTNQQSMVRCFH